MAHHLIMLCSSLTRSHCLFISIHPCLSHIAVIAIVAAILLSPSPLPLPPKLSPLQPPPLPPLLPPSPLRWLLPLPSPVGCCILGSDLSGFSPWANPDFSKKKSQKSTATQQTTLQSIWLLLTWLQPEIYCLLFITYLLCKNTPATLPPFWNEFHVTENQQDSSPRLKQTRLNHMSGRTSHNFCKNGFMTTGQSAIWTIWVLLGRP